MDEEIFSSPTKPPTHQVGQSLDALSVEELAERIAVLRAEIVRLEAAREAKADAARSAAAFFKSVAN